MIWYGYIASSSSTGIRGRVNRGGLNNIIHPPSLLKVGLLKKFNEMITVGQKLNPFYELQSRQVVYCPSSMVAYSLSILVGLSLLDKEQTCEYAKYLALIKPFFGLWRRTGLSQR